MWRGRRSVPHRIPVAERVRPRLLGPARHFPDGRPSDIEMALWDIVGKAVEKPVYALLGGKVHERLRSYTYLYPRRTRLARLFRQPGLFKSARRGETGAQIHGARLHRGEVRSGRPLFDLRSAPAEPRAAELCEAFCKTLREAVGTKCDLLFGTHGQFTVSGALRMARRIEPYEPFLYVRGANSRPRRPRRWPGSPPSAACRSRPASGWTTKYEFARVLETGAASILQMNLGRVGGILEGKKIAAMAEAHYAQIAPHLYCGPVVGAANIQLAACSPNFLILESIERWDGFHAQILKKPIRWEDRLGNSDRRAGPRRRAQRRGPRSPTHGKARTSISCHKSPPSGRQVEGCGSASAVTAGFLHFLIDPDCVGFSAIVLDERLRPRCTRACLTWWLGLREAGFQLRRMLITNGWRAQRRPSSTPSIGRIITRGSFQEGDAVIGWTLTGSNQADVGSISLRSGTW